MRALFLTTFLLIGISIMAQDQVREGGERHVNPLSPEQMATLQTKRMTLALDLTDEQQAQVKGLYLKRATERKANVESPDNGNANAKMPTAEEKFAERIERMDKQIAHKQHMKSILDDEQYAKWERMRLKRRPHGKGRKGISKK